MASASAAVHRYYAVEGSLLDDPAVPIEQAATVAGGEELDVLRSRVQGQRTRGERTTGSVEITSTTATAADLADPTTVTLEVCIDVSDVDVLAADGASLLAPGRPETSAVTATVVDRGDRGWLVEQVAARGDSCAA